MYLCRHEPLALTAAGFSISVGTAHTCTTAVIGLPAARAPGLLRALREANPGFVLLDDVFGVLHRSPIVAGFCYTQFMDTAQETNGLLCAHGSPKLPLETIRRSVAGTESAPEEKPRSPALADGVQ